MFPDTPKRSYNDSWRTKFFSSPNSTSGGNATHAPGEKGEMGLGLGLGLENEHGLGNGFSNGSVMGGGGGGRGRRGGMIGSVVGMIGDLLPTRHSLHLHLSPTSLLLLLLLLLSFLLGRSSSPTSSPSTRSTRPPSLFSLIHRPTPPFYIPPTQFRPPPAHPAPPAWIPNLNDPSSSFANTTATGGSLKPIKMAKGQLVPKIVHYVYGLKPGKDQELEEDEEGYIKTEGGRGEEFPYYAYLAVRSVIVNVKPDRIYFHHLNTPHGPFWDLLLPHLTLVKTRVPTKVLGRSVKHFAHRSDIIRLDVLLNMGGIYLDIDTYIIRPFDPFLYTPTTLGMEASPDSRRDALDPEGLCNGIIISQPHSSFLERWRASYHDFDPNEWAWHSVAKPWEIARRYPYELEVLSTRAFFWPGWWGDEIKIIHEQNDYDFWKSGQYAYHAWESLAMKYLGSLNPKDIRSKDTSFHRMVRPFIGDKDEKLFAQRQPKT